MIFSNDIDFSLTKLGASHEVVAGLFGVFALHLAGLWVELAEHVSVEAVVVLHVAEGRCAVWHGLKLFLIYSLGFDVVVVDVMS